MHKELILKHRLIHMNAQRKIMQSQFTKGRLQNRMSSMRRNRNGREPLPIHFQFLTHQFVSFIRILIKCIEHLLKDPTPYSKLGKFLSRPYSVRMLPNPSNSRPKVLLGGKLASLLNVNAQLLTLHPRQLPYPLKVVRMRNLIQHPPILQMGMCINKSRSN